MAWTEFILGKRSEHSRNTGKVPLVLSQIVQSKYKLTFNSSTLATFVSFFSLCLRTGWSQVPFQDSHNWRKVKLVMMSVEQLSNKGRGISLPTALSSSPVKMSTLCDSSPRPRSTEVTLRTGDTSSAEYSAIPCWVRQNPWSKKSNCWNHVESVWNSEFCVCQTEDLLICVCVCFFQGCGQNGLDVPRLWVFSASSPSMKFYPRSFPLQKEHIPPSLPPLHMQIGLIIQQRCSSTRRERASRGHRGHRPPRDHAPIKLFNWTQLLEDRDVVWARLGGRAAPGRRDKMESGRRAWASQWGLSETLRVRWTGTVRNWSCERSQRPMFLTS